MKPIIVALALSCGGDIITTHIGLAQGAHEANLPTQNVVVIDALIVGEAVAVSLLLNKLHKTHPKLAKGLGWGIVGIRVGIDMHNYTVIR